MRKRGVDVRFGEVTFRSPHVVTVDGQPLRSRSFLLCTGSSPAVPDIEGLHSTGYITNVTIFSLRELPTHLIVAGGGPVGVEMAQAFRRLGSAVTVLAGQRGLLPREDDEIRRAVGELFTREGITVQQSRLVGVMRSGEGLQARYAGEGGEGSLQGDRLLLALGRSPNWAGARAAAAGGRPRLPP